MQSVPTCKACLGVGQRVGGVRHGFGFLHIVGYVVEVVHLRRDAHHSEAHADDVRRRGAVVARAHERLERALQVAARRQVLAQLGVAQADRLLRGGDEVRKRRGRKRLNRSPGARLDRVRLGGVQLRLQALVLLRARASA